MSAEKLLRASLVAGIIGLPAALGGCALLKAETSLAKARAMERIIHPGMVEVAQAAIRVAEEAPKDCLITPAGPERSYLDCSTSTITSLSGGSSVNSFADIKVVMDHDPRTSTGLVFHPDDVHSAYVQFTLTDHNMVGGRLSGSVTLTREGQLTAPGGGRYASGEIADPGVVWAASISGGVVRKGHDPFVSATKYPAGVYDFDTSQPADWVGARHGVPLGELGTTQYVLNHLSGNQGDLAGALRVFNLPVTNFEVS